jgi:alpha-galactosidase
MWRSNGDYGDSWSRILANLDQEADLSPYAGPGHWNDPDILQVGLGGMTAAQDQAHFSAWSMLAAPLLAGNDLRSMSAATRAILTNREVIAIDQDTLGAEATRLSRTGDADVWTRPLANGDRAVMLLNRGDRAQTISTTAPDLGLRKAAAYSVRDLWAHRTSESAGVIAASVPAGSAVLFRVRPLRAGADRYAPLTDASVTPDVPAAYPGSPYHIASPGQTIAVTAGLRNDGRSAITRGRLTLSAPDGWTVTGHPATAPAIPSGSTVDGAWQVTVPPGTAPGTYGVTAHGTYRWLHGTRSGAADGTGGFQVLVPPAGQPYASDLTPLASTNGYGPVLVDRAYFGGPLTIHGVSYPHGLWTNAVASLDYYLGANCTRLTADLGLDDSVKGTGTVDYTISADGTRLYDSGTVTNTTPTLHASVDVTGAHVLRIDVGDAGDGITYDNADIAVPRLTCAA